MAVQFSKDFQDVMKRFDGLMEDHARAIGMLCMEWANLDQAIDHLLAPLLNSDDETTACITASMDKVGSRLEIVKKAAVIAGLNDDWIHWLNGIADRINKEFAPERNKFVHDCARLKDWKFMRVGRKATIQKSQSRQPSKLVLKPETKVSTADIDRLTLCIGSVTFALEVATHEFVQWRSHGEGPLFRPETAKAVEKGARLEKIPYFVLLANGPLNIHFITD